MSYHSDLKTIPEKLECAFDAVPGKLRKVVIGWAGWRQRGGQDAWFFSSADQKFFSQVEVEALFGDGEKKKRNKWLTKVEEEPLTLALYNLLGVRWDIDCGGVSPQGVRTQWDAQLGVPLEDSEKADYISVQEAYGLLRMDEGLPDLWVEEPEEEEKGRGEPEIESSQKEEGEEEKAEEDWPEDEVKELKGEGEVVFLRTFTLSDPMKPVVPEESLLEKGITKAKESMLGPGATFDLEKGGAHLVVLNLKPQLLIVKGEGEDESKKIPYLPDEAWVRGMARRAVKVMAVGSVAVVIAPATMPQEWLEGLQCIPSAWTFGVYGKVRRQSSALGNKALVEAGYHAFQT